MSGRSFQLIVARLVIMLVLPKMKRTIFYMWFTSVNMGILKIQRRKTVLSLLKKHLKLLWKWTLELLLPFC